MQNLKESETLYFSALHFQVWKEPQNSPPPSPASEKNQAQSYKQESAYHSLCVCVCGGDFCW